MSVLPIVIVTLFGAAPVQFQRHLIDNFPKGYQVAVADINGDGRPDVIALSTEADRVDWYENPGWQRHPVARTAKNIDLVVRDIDHNGRPVIALASGFYFTESSRGGEIQIPRQLAKANDLWARAPIAVDPVVHRLRWGDPEGNGRPVLIHAPIKGRLMLAAIEPWHGNQVVVYSPPEGEGLWQRHVIDESLQEGHALVTGDFDGNGMDEIVAGWRAGGGGLRLYKATDATGREFKSYDLDPGMPAECAMAADINGDGKLDLVVIGGRTNQLVWYENRTPSPANPSK